MTPFAYGRAADLAQAVALGARPGTMLLAGGTELPNWLRLGIASPERVLDISRLPGLDRIEEVPGGGLRVGALCRLNDVALDPRVARGYPVLSTAILKAASAQLRNLATIGGNPAQKTRCPYFRAEAAPGVIACNKRAPGSGCAVLGGEDEAAAVFGWTDACVATQPSDPAAALSALDAAAVTEAPGGSGRRIPMAEFHPLPTADPASAARDTVLRPGEVITAFDLGPPAPRSAYLKVRERESYEYATVSAAVVLDLDGRAIRRARIALGSVAHRPWRLAGAEERLAGASLDDAAALRAALDAAMAEARPLKRNRHKVTIGRNAALRAIRMAAEAGAPA